MAWRREDYGYAAATIAAVAFVAYIIAGTFGLVPSPLGHGRTDGLPQAEVAALAITNTASRTTLPSAGVAPAPAPVHLVARSDTPAALGPPSVFIDTKSGTTVKLIDKATVVGRALAPAGLKNVVVTFASSNGGPTTAFASSRCTNATTCTWSVAIPAVVGTYNVTATVTDAKGRTASSKAITLTVVNTGNAVGGVLGALTGSAPAAIGNVANTLLGALHL